MPAKLALSAATKLHIQKCNTCRDIENLSRTISCSQWYSMAGVKKKISTHLHSRHVHLLLNLVQLCTHVHVDLQL